MFVRRRASETAPELVLALVHTSDRGHARRIYHYDHHEPVGHREGEIASSEARQHVQRLQDPVDRGGAAHVHQRTVREARTIRMLQLLDHLRLRDYQENEHKRGVQETHSMVKVPDLVYYYF